MRKKWTNLSPDSLLNTYNHFFAGTDDPQQQQQQTPWLPSSQPRPPIVRNSATASSPYARPPMVVSPEYMMRRNVALLARSHAPTANSTGMDLGGTGSVPSGPTNPSEPANHPGSQGAGFVEQDQARARDFQSRMNAAAAQRIAYDNQAQRVAYGNQARARSMETVNSECVSSHVIGLRLSIDWLIGSWIALVSIDWLIDLLVG